MLELVRKGIFLLMLRRIRPFAFAICVISVFVLSAVISESMVMSPHKIILNASLEGENQDIQAVIGMGLPAGYVIDDFEISLSFDGTIVAEEAVSVYYCWLDSNLLVTFNREEVQANAEAFADQTVTAVVTGYLLNPDGDIVNVYGEDSVTILKPGKK